MGVLVNWFKSLTISTIIMVATSLPFLSLGHITDWEMSKTLSTNWIAFGLTGLTMMFGIMVWDIKTKMDEEDGRQRTDTNKHS